ncbi:MAG TPA: hypothetical protein VFF75_04360, partial [Methylophilaceae bacterium]|nr:hypothetical protein [Methylophilaceae bacterium]
MKNQGFIYFWAQCPKAECIKFENGLQALFSTFRIHVNPVWRIVNPDAWHIASLMNNAMLCLPACEYDCLHLPGKR